MPLYGTDPQLKAQLAIEAARRRQIAATDPIALEVATAHLNKALDHYAALTRAGDPTPAAR